MYVRGGDGGGWGWRIIGKFPISLSTLNPVLCTTNLANGPYFFLMNYIYSQFKSILIIYFKDTNILSLLAC